MKAWPAILLLLCAGGIGCIYSPKPIRKPMPIGIYFPPTNALAELSAAGFNLIVGAPSEPLLHHARQSGLSVLLHAARGRFTSEKEKKAAFRQLDRHPATWGWYLTDEPDLHQISPARMRAENAWFKRLVRKPTVIVLASGASVEKFGGIADRVAVDWYPVPWSSVGTVAREMRWARMSANGAPFLAVLQAFDWTAASDLLRTDMPLRPPTFQELRCMAYLALMQGAGGILFYAYQDATVDLDRDPELRRAVLAIASELRANSAIFRKRVVWWPTHSEYHGPAEAMFNEIGEARVSLSLFETAKGFYLMAANTTGQPVDFSLKIPVKGVRELKTLCSSDNFQVSGDWVRKTYEPFEVCILGPMKGTLADE